MAAPATTYVMTGAVTLEGHDVATFSLDVPMTVTSLKDRAGVDIKLDPIAPLVAAVLREMADAIDAPAEEGSTT